MSADRPSRKVGGWWGISRNVFVLGLVSLFTDVASEMIYPLLPLFLANTLGVQKSVIGLIEGVAESTASLLKLVSGWLADRTGRHKLLVGLGYGASACSRPLYALVAGPWQVLGLRFLDRLGKGVRTAPRDAIIAESAPPGLAGRAFGVQRAMDTVGAVIGPGLAVFLLPLFHGSYTHVFVAASLPGFLAVLLVIVGVQDPRHQGSLGVELPRLRWSGFDRRFKLFVAASFVFALGNSSNAFLLLRAQGLGIAAHLVPVAYMGYNLVSALVALPAGMLSDRFGRPKMLVAGYLTFAGIYWGFAAAREAWLAWVLFAGYGLYTGLTEGVEKAWVKDIAPDQWRGSAYGIYHFAVGLAALPASMLAGAIWDYWGPAVMFQVDAVIACAAMALFLASLTVAPVPPADRQIGP